MTPEEAKQILRVGLAEFINEASKEEWDAINSTWDAIANVFVAAIREAEEAERQACANDVCMYCGKRAPGYGPAEGPNEAGNWTHTPKGGGAPLLCHASSIHARARFIEARKG